MSPHTPATEVGRLNRRALLGRSAGIGLAATVSVPILAACTGSGTRSERPQSSSSELNIALTSFKSNNTIDPATGQHVTGINELLKSFMKQHPSIKVNAFDINANGANATQAKEQTLLISGKADILEGATLWPYYSQKLIRNLNSYFAKDHWQDNYIASIFTPPMERLMYPPWVDNPKDHISVPADLQTLSLAYDKQLFEDFGVEPLSNIPTIDEVLAKAPKLTGTNPRTGKKSYGMFYDPTSQAHIMLYYLGHGVDFGSIDANEPSKIKFDTPEIRSGIQGMVGVAKYCPPGFAIGQGDENWGTETNDVAINMSVSPSQMLPAVTNHLVDRFVVTQGVRNRSGHTFYVSANEYAISTKCKNPDAAWEVVKFLSGPAGQKAAYANYNDLPSWKDQNWVNDKTTPYASQFIATAQAARNAFFPEFVFKTFRPWIASVVSQEIHGKSVDLNRGLATMQRKAEEWVKSGADGLAKADSK